MTMKAKDYGRLASLEPNIEVWDKLFNGSVRKEQISGT
jgi:hypothetical protein